MPALFGMHLAAHVLDDLCNSRPRPFKYPALPPKINTVTAPGGGGRRRRREAAERRREAAEHGQAFEAEAVDGGRTGVRGVRSGTVADGAATVNESASADSPESANCGGVGQLTSTSSTRAALGPDAAAQSSSGRATIGLETAERSEGREASRGARHVSQDAAVQRSAPVPCDDAALSSDRAVFDSARSLYPWRAALVDVGPGFDGGDI